MSRVKIPFKLWLLLTIFRFVLRLARRRNGTVNRWLLNLVEIKVPPSTTPKNGVVSSDTVIDRDRNLWFRLFVPASAVTGEGMPIIVYYHGGGFALSSPNTFAHHNWCSRLAKELRAAVVSVNYRRSPEFRYPIQYEDGFDALKFVDENLESLPGNIDPKSCFLGGDSAGGNLAHHVAVEAGGCEFSNLKIVGLMVVQPFFGGEERVGSEVRSTERLFLSLDDTDWYWKAFLPNGSDRDHPAANVYGHKSTVDITRVKYPATLILMGGLDILNDRQRRYYDWLKNGGKEVKIEEHPDAFHGSFVFDDISGSSFFIEKMKRFMEKRT